MYADEYKERAYQVWKRVQEGDGVCCLDCIAEVLDTKPESLTETFQERYNREDSLDEIWHTVSIESYYAGEMTDTLVIPEYICRQLIKRTVAVMERDR